MPEKPAQRIKPLFRAAAPQRNAAAAYAELQVTSNYSFLRGASHPEELVYRAAELGLRAVAITDRHSLAGIVKAHAAAKEAGIPLVIGTAITLHQTLPQSSSTWRSCTDATEAQPSAAPESLMPFEVLLYPAGKTAYGRLCRLLSQGKLRSPKGRCLLTLEDLAHYQQGLFASVVIRNLRHPRLLAGLESLKSIFDCDRLSLIVSHTYGPDNNQHLDSLLHLGRLFDIPIAAANDVHYHIPERRKLQDVLTCIRRTCTLREAGFYLFQNAERCLKPPQEMLRLFSSLPQATRRTCEIADAALSFSLDQLIYQYPNEICPADKTPIQYLTELVWRGTAERYPQGIPPAVTGQIRHELALIEELHYEKYFLTVYDIVLFARTNSILC
ncbi:MAG TPA: PHP domain-containing protein, partial [Oligoflexia bacterium]|nr:PHP domain-containing protein [Oligoflexia bacterium]